VNHRSKDGEDGKEKRQPSGDDISNQPCQKKPTKSFFPIFCCRKEKSVSRSKKPVGGLDFKANFEDAIFDEKSTESPSKPNTLLDESSSYSNNVGQKSASSNHRRPKASPVLTTSPSSKQSRLSTPGSESVATTEPNDSFLEENSLLSSMEEDESKHETLVDTHSVPRSSTESKIYSVSEELPWATVTEEMRPNTKDDDTASINISFEATDKLFDFEEATGRPDSPSTTPSEIDDQGFTSTKHGAYQEKLADASGHDMSRPVHTGVIQDPSTRKRINSPRTRLFGSPSSDEGFPHVMVEEVIDDASSSTGLEKTVHSAPVTEKTRNGMLAEADLFQTSAHQTSMPGKEPVRAAHSVKQEPNEQRQTPAGATEADRPCPRSVAEDLLLTPVAEESETSESSDKSTSSSQIALAEPAPQKASSENDNTSIHSLQSDWRSLLHQIDSGLVANVTEEMHFGTSSIDGSTVKVGYEVSADNCGGNPKSFIPIQKSQKTQNDARSQQSEWTNPFFADGFASVTEDIHFGTGPGSIDGSAVNAGYEKVTSRQKAKQLPQRIQNEASSIASCHSDCKTPSYADGLASVTEEMHFGADSVDGSTVKVGYEVTSGRSRKMGQKNKETSSTASLLSDTSSRLYADGGPTASVFEEMHFGERSIDGSTVKVGYEVTSSRRHHRPRDQTKMAYSNETSSIESAISGRHQRSRNDTKDSAGGSSAKVGFDLSDESSVPKANQRAPKSIHGTSSSGSVYSDWRSTASSLQSDWLPQPRGDQLRGSVTEEVCYGGNSIDGSTVQVGYEVSARRSRVKKHPESRSTTPGLSSSSSVQSDWKSTSSVRSEWRSHRSSRGSPVPGSSGEIAKEVIGRKPSPKSSAEASDSLFPEGSPIPRIWGEI